MSNFNDLLDASVDLGQAWADRHRKRPEQPAVVLESEFIKLYETCKEIAAQRDEWMTRANIYRDTMRLYAGRVLDKDEANAHMRKLANEHGIP